MKYTKYILSILIPFVSMYIIGSLTNGSFNVNNWGYESKIICCVVCLVFAIYLLIHNVSLELSGLNNIEVIDPETVEADGGN